MQQACLYASKYQVVGKIDPNLFGSFVEHMGRTIYTGIYEPSHPLADENGFRMDVIKAVTELGVSNIRYPGGNFVSCYHWLDGVGKKEDRKSKLEIAWGAIETNQFGLDEFMKFVRTIDAMPILTVNLGTRGIEDAMSIVEYCNHTGGTYFSELRKSHGAEQPYGVKIWCLGNEMDGPWQVGHKTAEEYGRLAAECAKAMKRIDPEIRLISCGSSLSSMETYPQWELTTLEHTYEYVDYISLHQYYGGQELGTYEFLSQSQNMERYIQTVCAVCDVIKAKKRSDKTINISFDEWGVWSDIRLDKEDPEHKWQVAPQLSEMVYTFQDTLLFASMMLALLKHCDRVKIACQSLLANVSATIMTQAGGDCWLQPIYYPFAHIATFAKGTVLDVHLECPTYSSQNGVIPYLNIVCSQDTENNEVVLFVVNRSLEEDYSICVDLYGIEIQEILQHIEMNSEDIKATNHEDHRRIVPVRYDLNREMKGKCELSVKKFSWNVFRLKYLDAQ